MEKRHIPPSRKRYEAKYPLITIRVAKDVKERFQLLHSKAGKSARNMFKDILNTYIEIKSQSQQVDRPTSKPSETIYFVVDTPFDLSGIFGPPDGWKGPLPEKGEATTDMNKIKKLRELGYKIQEVIITF